MPRCGSSATPRSDGDIFWDEIGVDLNRKLTARERGGYGDETLARARAASETPASRRREHRRNTDKSVDRAYQDKRTVDKRHSARRAAGLS
jgi:hypothetical protein